MIRVSVHGLDEVRERLHDMQARAKDLSPAWEELLTWWASTEREQFESKGRRWRTQWRPLAPSTIAEKRRKGFLGEPLVRSGEMRASLTRRPLGIEHVGAHDLTAGTRSYPAHFHQTGTRHMPARPLVNARAVASEGAASAAVLSWIMEGRPNIGGVQRLER